jgi:hypothetical protein
MRDTILRSVICIATALALSLSPARLVLGGEPRAGDTVPSAATEASSSIPIELADTPAVPGEPELVGGFVVELVVAIIIFAVVAGVILVIVAEATHHHVGPWGDCEDCHHHPPVPAPRPGSDLP